MPTNYFAYGSNMDECRIRDRMVKFSERFGAKLHDWELVFNKEVKEGSRAGYANIRPKSGSKVEGILYKVDSETQLDGHEGFPNHYRKKSLNLESCTGEIFKCIAYVANPNKVRNGLKPERSYLCHLLAGKKFLSKDYFLKLCQTDVIDDK